MSSHVTIVVPVYGDWESLKDCIESLIKFVDDKHRVMFVNDCGPEADFLEENIKKSINGVVHFEYHRNPRNLGFLQNCNRAVSELDGTENDILLLNSDTIVTEHFLEELQKVFEVDDTVAVVSPRSNNATIATVPIKSAPQKGIDPKKSYEVFLKLKNRLAPYDIAPVAHGFCMLIRREVIEKYGLFDEIFGKGYGEETDFCQRIAKEGYKSAYSNQSFVFHMEARSFTMETKMKLLQVNDVIINKRYPNYRREVRDYRIRAEAREAAILTPWPQKITKKIARAVKNTLRSNKITHRIVVEVKSLLRLR